MPRNTFDIEVGAAWRALQVLFNDTTHVAVRDEARRIGRVLRMDEDDLRQAIAAALDTARSESVRLRATQLLGDYLMRVAQGVEFG